MQQLFVVIRRRGPAWNTSTSLEDQKDWNAHASFMDALEEEGFVLLGGPLEGTSDALLVVRAKSSEEIVSRLSADPWTATDILYTAQISPWTLRLGSIASKR
jgi:uncharacterized protein YciI